MSTPTEPSPAQPAANAAPNPGETASARAAATDESGGAGLQSAAALVKRLGPAGPVALCATVLPPLGSIALFAYMPTISAWLKSHGHLGLTAYIVAFAVLAGIALLPTYAQSALGGFAFGITLGLPAALLGFGGGAIIGYEIASRASGQRVEKIIAEKPRWKAVRDAFAGPRDADGTARPHGFWKTLGMVTLFRIPPNSPFALMNFVMASVHVPRLPFVLGTMLGMAPRSAAAVVIGAGVKSMTKDELESAMPRWVWIVGVILTLAVVVLVCWLANRAVKKITAGHAPAAG